MTDGKPYDRNLLRRNFKILLSIAIIYKSPLSTDKPETIISVIVKLGESRITKLMILDTDYSGHS